MNTQKIRFAAITILDIALLFTAPIIIELFSKIP